MEEFTLLLLLPSPVPCKSSVWFKQLLTLTTVFDIKPQGCLWLLLLSGLLDQSFVSLATRSPSCHSSLFNLIALNHKNRTFFSPTTGCLTYYLKYLVASLPLPSFKYEDLGHGNFCFSFHSISDTIYYLPRRVLHHRCRPIRCLFCQDLPSVLLCATTSPQKVIGRTMMTFPSLLNLWEEIPFCISSLLDNQL